MYTFVLQTTIPFKTKGLYISYDILYYKMAKLGESKENAYTHTLSLKVTKKQYNDLVVFASERDTTYSDILRTYIEGISGNTKILKRRIEETEDKIKQLKEELEQKKEDNESGREEKRLYFL